MFLVLMSLGLLVGFARPAAAHTELLDTSPLNGATVDALPPQLELTFADQVDLGALVVSVTDTTGVELINGSPTTSPGRLGLVVVPVRAAAVGAVTMSWLLLGPDGHPLSGVIVWTVGDRSAETTEIVGGAAGDAPDSGGRPSSEWAERLVSSGRLLTYGSLALLLGIPAFFLLVWPEGGQRRSAATVLLLGAALGIAGPLLRMVSTAMALGLPGGWSAGLSMFLRTGAGRALLVQVALVPIVAQVAWHLLRTARPKSGLLVVAGSGFSAALVWCVVQQGHGRTSSTFGAVWQTVHVGAMSVWIGSLVGLIAIALPVWTRRGTLRVEARARLAEFAMLAFDVVAALLASGVFLLYDRWVTSDGLARPYLTILGLKLLAVGASLCAAWSGRRWVGTRRPLGGRRPQAVRGLMRTVTREVGLLGTVLAATAVLAGTPPSPTRAPASPRSGEAPPAVPDLSGPVQVVPVTGRSFAFEPALLTVPAGVPFEVALRVDDGDTMHDLVIDGRPDQPVGALPGMTGSGFFQIDEPGQYLIFCGIEGHRASGMTGTLVITGSGS